MDIKEVKNNISFRHPWEISRRMMLVKMLPDETNNVRIADIGAGDLYIVTELLKLSKYDVVAVDNNFDEQKKEDRIIKYKDLSEIESQSINIVVLSDVLEHIEHERVFLDKVSRIIKPSGMLLVTVPAHEILFSNHDIFLDHFRRYGKDEIVEELNNSGFIIKEYFYFYAILLLARLIEFSIKKILLFIDFKYLIKLWNNYTPNKKINNWLFPENSLITKTIVIVLNFDFRFNRFLSRLKLGSIGLSIFVLCKKK